MILLYLLMYTVLGFFLFFITACYILIFCIFLKRQTVQLIVTIHSALITVPTPVPASAGPVNCPDICVEGCQCDEGWLSDGDACGACGRLRMFP